MEENYKLAKWLDNELSDDELKQFESEPDYHLYQKIKDYSSALTTSDFDDQQTLSNILASKKETVKTIPLRTNWLLRIAAILVLGFGLYYATVLFSSENIETENGKQHTFLLPDNSEVALNSGSEIKYRKWNWDNNRKLTLAGEAYFKVAKGKRFEVATALGTVTVLGTQFNVKVRDNRFDVTCFEGRVKVDYQNHHLILIKGNTVSFENNEKLIEEPISFAQPHWKQHQIAFEKAGLTAVFEEIERTYNIKIDAAAIQSEQVFSGKIPANDIEVALQVIATTYHLKISKITNTHYAIQVIK